MSKNLVIVESPGKVKTIEKTLGKDFHVLASQGHVRDIEGVGKNSIGVDFEHDYAPNYAIDPKKKHLIEELKKESKAAEMVWLASDEDREGEAIAWHLKEVLGLKSETTRRIVFHEITPAAIQNAIQTPRDIDYNLVNAQQARRVLDRIVGFELSPVLWKKLMPGLSAGRVQSVAVRLIVDREREINSFQPTASYRLTAVFEGIAADGERTQLKTELNHHFQTKEEALEFLSLCKNGTFIISSIQMKPALRTPAPPFTTSSLQQEAARKLHFPVAKTMRLAQSLYEAGRITYMRTDSVNLSSLALGTTKKTIIEQWGERYHKTRQYHTSSKGAQEAHEAIRPTYIDQISAGTNDDEKKLYELIWKRTAASQMADAELEQTRIEISLIPNDTQLQKPTFLFVASGEVVTFDGFMKVYAPSTDEEKETTTALLPQFKEHTLLTGVEITAQQTFTKAPYRYTEGSFVKKMEELGIGRPSTYQTIVETIKQRKYVVIGSKTGQKRDFTTITLKNGKLTEKTKSETYGADSQKLMPTDLGFITNDFLVEQFPDILNYDFTAEEEKNFDEIAEGKQNWVKVVDNFYKNFHPSITAVEKGRLEGRELGIDPKSGRVVTAKIGRRGPCIQIGTAQDEDKPLFASLAKGQSIYNITLDEALALFDSPFPYTVGEYEGKTLVVNTGIYGPYVKQDDTYYSVPKDIDATHLSLEDAIQIIEAKRQKQLPIHVFGDIQILNGRFGPYIKYNNANYKIPRGVKAEELTEEKCREIIETPASVTKKSTRTSGKRK
ncbi:MAG: type I DNA topoisomerase [Paludibacteraceae bacterium]|nr:type I DNA topoisomerase [Paludibacteraceae bacterium]